MPALTALPVWPDWTDGVLETRAFRTHVFTAEDGTEQRQQLRGRARRRLRFRARTLDALTGERLATLLHGLQGGEFALPWWPQRTRTTAAAVATDTTVQVDTTGLDFVAGNPAILVRSPTVFEVVTVDAVSAGSIDVVDPLAADWPSGTVIVPAFPATAGPSLTLTRHAKGMDVAVDALVAPLSVPVAAGSAGDAVQVCTAIRMPNAGESPNELLERHLVTLDGELGPTTLVPFDAGPTATVSIPVFYAARAEVTALWAWFDGVLGMLTPSWLPGWHRAMTLAAPAAAIDTAITIRAIDYTTRWFPSEARRHLAIITGPSTIVHRRVTAAVDNADGTETLTLDGAVGSALTARSLIALMYYARAASDELEVTWYDPDLALASIAFRELPTEVPAST